MRVGATHKTDRALLRVCGRIVAVPQLGSIFLCAIAFACLVESAEAQGPPGCEAIYVTSLSKGDFYGSPDPCAVLTAATANIGKLAFSDSGIEDIYVLYDAAHLVFDKLALRHSPDGGCSADFTVHLECDGGCASSTACTYTESCTGTDCVSCAACTTRTVDASSSTWAGSACGLSFKTYCGEAPAVSPSPSPPPPSPSPPGDRGLRVLTSPGICGVRSEAPFVSVVRGGEQVHRLCDVVVYRLPIVDAILRVLD